MAFPENNLNPAAIYWTAGTVDGFGEHTHAKPSQINCRWCDEQKEFVTAEGEKKISNAFVQVPQSVDIGGYLFLGSLTTHTSLVNETHPEAVAGAFRVLAFSSTPTLDGSAFYREAVL